jgi:PKD repeat protein
VIAKTTSAGRLVRGTAFSLFYLLVCAHAVGATVRYVWTNSPSPMPPFTSWENAAHDIQSAIDHAEAGDEVLVTNGFYDTGGRVAVGNLTNRIAITNAITVRSVNGPEYTTIVGRDDNGFLAPNAIRCAYAGPGCVLAGFSLTGGATDEDGNHHPPPEDLSGGGAWADALALISNCVVELNRSHGDGGGVYGGRLVDCRLIKNLSERGDGAGAAHGVLERCHVRENYALGDHIGGQGGGVASCDVYDSLIEENLAENRGAGAWLCMLRRTTLRANGFLSGWAWGYHYWFVGGGAGDSTLYECIVESNRFYRGGGLYNCNAYNSLIIGNVALEQGGGTYNTLLHHCVVTENRASYGGGVAWGSNFNCVVYHNQAIVLSNHCRSGFSASCTAPLPPGPGNIADSPGLVGPGWLAEHSPCRGAGNPDYSSGVDLDGRAWLNPPSMGCREDDPLSKTGGLSVVMEVDAAEVGAGYPVAFRGVVSGVATRVAWTFGDGFAESNGLTAVHAFTEPGEYEVSFHAWNNDHPDGVTATQSVQILAPAYHYVDPASTNPVPPYASWESAATQVADAVAAAWLPGATVLVSSGQYALAATLTITNAVTVRAVNGAVATSLIPANTNSAFRLVHVGNRGVFEGFTLSGSRDGGASAEQYGKIVGCVISNNFASEGGGVKGGRAYNCLIVGNQVGGYGGGASSAALINCTVVGNVSTSRSTVISGVMSCIVINSIVYSNWLNNWEFGIYGYVCTHPSAYPALTDFSVVTDPPQFAGTGDYRLAAGSPCRDTGSGEFVEGAVDLAGNPRVVNGAVDMGAYEYQGAGPADYDADGIPSGWEMARGLNPFVVNEGNTDGDWMTDREEYIADTDPLDGGSWFDGLQWAMGLGGGGGMAGAHLYRAAVCGRNQYEFSGRAANLDGRGHGIPRYRRVVGMA